jgi:peptidyl-dipeptidase Dcp
VHKDVASMQKIVDEGGNFKISPLSLLFGESSKRKYDLDQNVVKEYLQLKTSEKACFGCW